MADKEMDEWWAERTPGQKVVVGVGFGLIGAGLLFLFGLVVMWLWNWLMPDIFGLPELGYWQAWGLLILSTILFKKFDFGSDDSKSRRADRKRKRKLREYMQESGDSPSADTDGVTQSEDTDGGEAKPAPEQPTENGGVTQEDESDGDDQDGRTVGSID
jgi:hypothetical protein